MSNTLNATTLTENQVEIIRQYKTADGQMFSSKEEAIDHSKKLEVKNQLKHLFEGMTSWDKHFSFDSFMNVIINNSVDVRDCLSKYISKTSRNKNKKAEESVV